MTTRGKLPIHLESGTNGCVNLFQATMCKHEDSMCIRLRFDDDVWRKVDARGSGIRGASDGAIAAEPQPSGDDA